MKKYLFIVLLVGVCFGVQKSNIQPKISTNEYHYLDIICLEEKENIIHKNAIIDTISDSYIVLNNKKIIPLNSIIGCYEYLDNPLNTLFGVGVISGVGCLGIVYTLSSLVGGDLDFIFGGFLDGKSPKDEKERRNRQTEDITKISFYTITSIYLFLYFELNNSKRDTGEINMIMIDWSNEEKINYFNKYNYLTPLQNK